MFISDVQWCKATFTLGVITLVQGTLLDHTLTFILDQLFNKTGTDTDSRHRTELNISYDIFPTKTV